ncbi:LamG-like jellyroll fold domain-containing protein [Metabacillus litoralis]|uniref:LamG-like jellyroll fold domain-containing protein n=1 Tax=Metabacillus litoralis TaxID=152268 RepID=UPI00299D2E53|nr:glycoside hydrolase family 43 C-terminal domain-containing protein [Metabacillus litoralis]
MKKQLLQKFLILLFVFVIAIPSSAFKHVPKVQAAEVPVFQNASVHDPSVIKVDDMFYVFGSHLAAAKSPDLMKWDKFASEVNADNPLFDDVRENLKETFEWAETDTLWAADVIQLEDGKFYMYYNACKGDSPRSALGIAVADSVEGPYEDLGIILKSGMWDQISEDGTIYDATIHPNAVDPDTFFDSEGKLWMTYGSYSGGIFILEMDPETGKPLPDQGYGKKLLGGNHSRIEASYIQYVPETGYYYMYLSFGGLDAIGGYNMRVVRSENPDGPYLDAEGNDMIDVKANPDLPIFDDASIEPFGVKLMGNFLFDRKVGEPGTGIGTGYVSPGHNSVYYDEETGEQFLIFHTRFPERGEQHEIRVHKMYTNSNGWPVVSPYQYAGESLETVTEADVIGEYKLINHGKDITAEIKKSVLVGLNSDGTITGEVTGTWEFIDDNKVQLQVEGQTYDGVFVRQWDPTTQSYLMTFTTLSSEGIAIWGSKAITQTDEELVEQVKNNLDLGDTSKVISNLTLPTEGYRNTEIKWQSTHPEIVSEDGAVTRPNDADATVTLTATITKGGFTTTKEFSVVVLHQKEGKLVAHYAFEDNIEDSTGNVEEGTVTGATIESTDGTNTYGVGKVGQAAIFDGSSGIRLPNGLISSNEYTVSFWLNPEEKTNFTTAFFGARNQDNWVSFVPQGGDWVQHNTMIWSTSNGNWVDANTNLALSTNEWAHVAFTVNNGTLNIYINGVNTYSGENFGDVFTTTDGVFALGVNFWDTPFKGLMDELLIYDNMSLSEEEILDYYQTGEVPGKVQPTPPGEGDGGETPTTPEQPGEGDGGETPTTPEQPGEGDEGETPTTPEQPGEGDEGETPTTPEQPGEGDGGETPTTPEQPGEGDGGETPTTPEQPGEGDGGETPTTPEQPGEGDGGETPTTPEQPGEGDGGETPTTPSPEKEKPKKDKKPATVSPKVKDGKVIIDNKELEKIKENNGQLIIEFKNEKSPKATLTLTKENISLLKDKGVEQVLFSPKGVGSSISIPLSMIEAGADVEIKRIKDTTDSRFVSGIYDFTIKVGDATLHSFQVPLELSFEVDMKKVKNTDNLRVVYFNEDTKKWEIVEGAVYKDGKVNVSTDHLSIYSVVEIENEEEVLELASASTESYELPNTATSSFNFLAMGIMILVIGGVFFFLQRRKNGMAN